MVSRFTLAAKYGLATYLRKNTFHSGIRDFSKEAFRRDTSRTGFIIMCATHTVVAIIYLGITFFFANSVNSLVRVTWYVIGVVEACVGFVVSYWLEELSFKDKALQDRMKTATLLILGEGVIVVTEHNSIVANNANPWSTYVLNQPNRGGNTDTGSSPNHQGSHRHRRPNLHPLPDLLRLVLARRQDEEAPPAFTRPTQTSK